MSIHHLLVSLEATTVAGAMRGEFSGTEWLFPIVETLHVLSLTLVFGSIAMVDLRLIGVVSRGTAVSKLTAELLPITWIAWCSAAVFGSLMFSAKATTYAGNIQFRLKFLCMLAAGINMLIFQLGAYKTVANWDAGRPTSGARAAGVVSLSLWIGVIFFGRWTGFTLQ